MNFLLVLKQKILGVTPRLITVDDVQFFWLKQLSLIRERIHANQLLDIHPAYGEYSRNIPILLLLHPCEYVKR